MFIIKTYQFSKLYIRYRSIKKSLPEIPNNTTICTDYLTQFDNLNTSNIYINCYNNNTINSQYICLRNPLFDLSEKYLLKCGINYHQIYNDSINNNSFINCFNSLDNYFYIDSSDIISYYKPCYSTCKKCLINGNDINHNCIECNDDYPIYTTNNNYKNCYEEVITTENIEGTIKETIKETSNIIITEKINVITTEKINVITTEKINVITTEKIEGTINIVTKANIIMENIINTFDQSFIDEGNNMEKKEENVIFTLTSSENQKDETKNKNKTTIDLGECESKLRKFYNISEDRYLYILKLDVFVPGVNIPKIEYEVYFPLYNDALIKLNLTICEGTEVDVFIPVKINNDDMDKHNKSSDYYNDVCYKTTSDKGTDISLSDRKNQFAENSMSLCEEDCSLASYNETQEKAQCSCMVKINIPLLNEVTIDKKKLLDGFTDIKNFANIYFLKCYKSVLKGEYLINNYGFFIFAFSLGFYVILFFLFFCKYYYTLMKLIKDIEEAKIKLNELQINNDIINNNNLITNNDNKK